MPHQDVSIWEDHLTEKFQAGVSGSSAEADVIIVGAGITGVTTAYLLAKQGVRVLLLESKQIGAGVTAQSTGHLTVGLDAYYSYIASRVNKKTARQTAQSMREAIDWVENVCRTENIAGDFQRVPAYLYTEDAQSIHELEDETRAMTEAGLSAELVDHAPLPFSNLKALRLPQQALFNPLAYIHGLAQRVVQHGGQIIENAHVTHVSDKEPCEVTLQDSRKFRAKQVVLATHTPIEFNLIQTELQPYRSYSLAATLREPVVPDGLYWDTLEFYHYIRTYRKDGKYYLIVGGEDHKVGQPDVNENEPMERLEQYTMSKFPVAEITHRWSSQHFKSVDGLPYIGKSPFGTNKFIATGFTGDGLTFGTVSALLLSDLLTGKENPFADTYTPGRLRLAAAASDLAEQSLDFALRFVKDRFGAEADDLLAIQPGEGKLVRLEGKQIAAYRDEKGAVHTLSPTCPHMGCHVHWNDAERTWDCPCHGGRFSATGEILNGPPVHGLEAVDLQATQEKG